MNLTDILLFAAVAPFFTILVPRQWRAWGLFILTLAAVGWLQYQSASSYAAFTLVVLTILLTIWVWWIIQPPLEGTGEARNAQDRLTLKILIGVLGVMWLLISLEHNHFDIMPFFVGGLMIVAGAMSLERILPSRAQSLDTFKNTATIAILIIVVILFGLKIPALTAFFSEWFGLSDRVQVAPLAWLGFSYVAFRLISLLRDFQYGRLPQEGYTLRDVVTYVLFFPAYTAGPIDQAQRFIPDLHALHAIDAQRLVQGCARIAIGVFKKFVVADSLALLSLSETLIERTDNAIGLWLLVYVYAFQIYFDFSGYSDVAIGLGKLYGITLPENFDRPYLQPNLQQFWNRWHITLSMWFRGYYFSPISRALIRSKYSLPLNLNVFIAQVSTMVLIGLWHGVTLNFFLWGLWHGLGLFIFKLISDRTRLWHRRITQRTIIKRIFYVMSVFITFHFVALGWVFFALPNASQSVKMIIRLFGG